MRHVVLGIGLLALVACGQERQGGTAVGNPGRTYVRLAPPADPVQAGPYVGWVRADAASITVTATPCMGDPVVETLADVSLLDGAALDLPGGHLCALEVQVDGVTAGGDGLQGYETLDLPSGTASLPLGGRFMDDDTWIVELGEPGAPAAIAERSALFRDVGADGVLSPLERSQEPLAVAPEREAEATPVLLVVGSGGTRLVVGVGDAMPVLLSSTGPGGYDVAAGGGGGWVAAGPEGVSVSDDLGTTWTELGSFPDVTGVSSGDGAFWGVGGGGHWWSLGVDGADELAVDDVAWTAVTGSPYGAVRVGTGVIDVDGRRTELPGVELRAVAEHDGQLVAVGDQGARYVSDDGVAWDDVSQAGGPDLRHVVHTGRAWVAMAEFLQETVQNSADGRTWTDVGAKGVNDVVAVDGVLYGVLDTGMQRSTDDGATWTFTANFFPKGGVLLTGVAAP